MALEQNLYGIKPSKTNMKYVKINMTLKNCTTFQVTGLAFPQIPLPVKWIRVTAVTKWMG